MYNTTSRHLSEQGTKHFVVVEDSEFEQYSAALYGSLATVLVLDDRFKREYETCDDLGLSRSTGPGPARNFAWNYAIDMGAEYHWVMDDNIRGFYRLHENKKYRCNSSAMWAAMEAFCRRFENVAMAGPNYEMFAPRKSKLPPFTTNTRIYSCNLIRNDVPFRWRGRYNEDTILSLDMLTAGWCTIQFNAFLQDKMGTQIQKGGNTAEFYHAEGTVNGGARYADTGTLNKSAMLVREYPEVAKIKRKFGRIHHVVDYSRFKANRFVLRHNLPKGTNEFGLRLEDTTET